MISKLLEKLVSEARVSCRAYLESQSLYQRASLHRQALLRFYSDLVAAADAGSSCFLRHECRV